MMSIMKDGDIVGLSPKGFEKLLVGLIAPKVNVYHHVILGSFVEDEEDWVIYESMPTGVKVGRLSWYKDQKIKVYRYDEKIGKKAVNRATLFGRRGYDFILPAKLLMIGIWYWLRNGFRLVPYDLLKDMPNSAMLCTELVVEAYRPFVKIVPDGIAATPSAIEQARIDGILSLVFDNTLSSLFRVHGLRLKR